MPGEQRGGAAGGRGGRERGVDSVRQVVREVGEVAVIVAHESRLGVGGKQRDDDLEGGGCLAQSRTVEGQPAVGSSRVCRLWERAQQELDDINVRIRDINRRGAEGPPSTVMVLDPEAEVERWRRQTS